MNKGILSLAALLSCTSPNSDTGEQHPQTEYAPQMLETGNLHYAASFPASRVDLTAYYFFGDDNCLPELREALTAAAAYNLVGTVYVPSFYADFKAGMFEDIPLPKKEWGTMCIGLNDIVFQQDTPEKALFFDPLGDTTGYRDHRRVKDYAVVAQEDLYDSFKALVETKEVRPEIQMYLYTN